MKKQLLTLPIIVLLCACKRDLPSALVSETPHKTLATTATADTLTPIEDAYVRSGTYADTNFGSEEMLTVKGAGSTGNYRRYTYLKFDLTNTGTVASAILRIYGRNTEDSTGISVQVYNTEDWSEDTVTYNNRPTHSSKPLASQTITNSQKYYEFDVSSFVKGKTGVISLMVKNFSNQNRRMDFNSRESKENKPQLILSSDYVLPPTGELPGYPDSVPPAAADTGTYDHVFTVVFENKTTDSIFNNADATFINSLRPEGVTFTDFNALTNPSYPNYITIFSGSTQGVEGDGCISGQPFDQPNLYTALQAAGKSFAWYSEKLPATGSDVCSAADGLYREKHNPTTIFKNVPGSINKKFEDIDWQNTSVYSSLENVVFITPDMVHDMHDAPVKAGDAWLQNTLGTLINWCMKPENKSLFVVYFDEGKKGNNRIPVMMVGTNLKKGFTASSSYNHGSFTKMLLSHFGASVDLTSNVSSAAEINDIWE